MLTEKKSICVYYLEKGGVEKLKFAEFINNELDDDEDEEEEMSGEARKALRAFTTNLMIKLKKAK